MKNIIIFLTCFLLTIEGVLAQDHFSFAKNPILPGFHPDPTICRVDSDYYICNSSFTWYPGLPIYRSRDLVNWQLVGHVIDRPDMITLDGVRDKDGIWAPTLRYREGRFYLFCNVSNRGNFFLTSEHAEGPWSDPVWVKDAPGIDPDIFWDDDGRSYMLANQWGLKEEKYKGKCVIWIQEIDLLTGQLIGQRHYLTTGHAANAKGTEGAHLYKVGKRYALLTAEGGTDYYHAVTIHWSNKLFGPYAPQQLNPVLTHRHLGHKANIQCVGHADMVKTNSGQWYAVCLGKRMIDGRYTFTRETFLCPVELQQGEFVFNPGKGCLSDVFPRPNLPWTPVSDNDEQWYYERIPYKQFCTPKDNRYILDLQPETLDSLSSPSLIMKKVREHSFCFSVNLEFQPRKMNEEAGLVLHRNNNAYVALLKSKDYLRLVCKSADAKNIVASIPYKQKQVVLRMIANDTLVTCYYGANVKDMKAITAVSLIPLADDNKSNRFNGLGIGVYAGSNGKKSSQKASFSVIPQISEQPVDKQANAATRKLYSFLRNEVWGKKVLAGCQAEWNYNTKDADSIYQVCGKYPAVNVFDFQHFDQSWIDYRTDVAKKWHDAGGIVGFMWHIHMPASVTNNEWQGFYSKGKKSCSISPMQAATDGTPENILFRQKLEGVAQLLLYYQQQGIPILWRPLHEGAGRWFWWGAEGAEAYKKLYRYMYDYFQQAGIHNLLWVWTSEIGDDDWYPGDDYVDIVARDAYPKDNFSHVSLSKDFKKLQRAYPNKMIALTECNSVPSWENMLADDARWLMVAPWCGGGAFDNGNTPSFWRQQLNDENIISREDLILNIKH